MILGIEFEKEIEEFEKAEIQIKTVRLREDYLPKESVSFSAFKFEDIVNESWETSTFKNNLDHKFLFIFFRYINDCLVLEKATFWSMPYRDKLEAKKVWLETKKVVKSGKVVKEVKKTKNNKERRLTNLPNKDFNRVAHVRPHARNSNDEYPLPRMDEYTKKNSYTKHCFWLNSSYVKEAIYGYSKSQSSNP